MARTIQLPNFVSVTLHQEKTGGFWVESKELPLVYSQGETVDETLHNFIDAVLTHFEVSPRQPKPSLQIKISSSRLMVR